MYQLVKFLFWHGRELLFDFFASSQDFYGQRANGKWWWSRMHSIWRLWINCYRCAALSFYFLQEAGKESCREYDDDDNDAVMRNSSSPPTAHTQATNQLTHHSIINITLYIYSAWLPHITPLLISSKKYYFYYNWLYYYIINFYHFVYFLFCCWWCWDK